MSWLKALLSCPGLERLTFRGPQKPVPFLSQSLLVEVRLSDTLKTLRLESVGMKEPCQLFLSAPSLESLHADFYTPVFTELGIKVR
jgi:hypothetical protein